MKPSLAKGTRDFLPHEAKKRQYIFDTLREVFECYDFLPIETPAIERLDTLQGKYGLEGDQLLFKLLNNGDFLAKVDEQTLTSRDSQQALSQLAKRGLRYDLTVPLARYVVMHRHELNMPFRRYQMQPVWRADRPQKGRYQEFYQCDVDIVGSDALLHEAELLQIYDRAFHLLGLPVTIVVNHRAVLQGIAECCGMGEDFVSFTQILDKRDKIGDDKMKSLLLDRGMDETGWQTLLRLLDTKTIADLRHALVGTDIGSHGLDELEQILTYMEGYELQTAIVLDWALARGLSYYTGFIVEVVCPEASVGSLGGGGRYANLTGVFGAPGLSGVGISFGVARIFDAMTSLGKWPNLQAQSGQVLFIGSTVMAISQAMKYATHLRGLGLSCGIYPTADKMKKQLKYANNGEYAYVAIIGEQELADEVISLKDMTTGAQDSLSIDEVVKLLDAQG